jgi:hypothetical protein
MYDKDVIRIVDRFQQPFQLALERMYRDEERDPGRRNRVAALSIR